MNETSPATFHFMKKLGTNKSKKKFRTDSSHLVVGVKFTSITIEL